jgi:GNAT superfamily N-acetyltransferase
MQQPSRRMSVMNNIRPCRADELGTLLDIINSAAVAYRGVIPPDRWHEPYMSVTELHEEIAAGVELWGYEMDGALAGVMGIQAVHEVNLIRHAYVRPDRQRHGIGGVLIEHLRRQSLRPMLVGTWAAATWAIDFYRRHRFELVREQQKVALLKRYWSIPDRQIETSVVLANPPLDLTPA